MPLLHLRGLHLSTRLRFIPLLLALSLLPESLSAAPVPVRYKEGLTHGFLVLSTLDGKPIAEGDLTEVVQGNRVNMHLVYRFKDGSLQDETTIFSQHTNFRLISYHMVQKGPSFKQPMDVSFVTSSGQVTVRYTDDKGNEKTEIERMKLPPDLANGMVLTIIKNVRPEGSTEVSMLVATPKPRLVKLVINSQGKEPFSLVGSPREALHFVIKIDIGGVTGLLASLLGKEPPNAHVWIIGGEAPTFVKSETIAFLGGPIWRTELVSPVWPKERSPDEKNANPSK
jgi:hypothetical protein